MLATSKAYLVGGGIGSLAAAAFMIRDGAVPGENITIFESGSLLGGSLDGAGDPEQGYSLRGGRMLTTDNYECTWDLFKSIPALKLSRSETSETSKASELNPSEINPSEISHPGDIPPFRSVYDETMEFNELHRSHAMARLVDSRRARVAVTSMGFSARDRIELLKFSNASEETLEASCITDWFAPEFFDTVFWYMWATTFAFQPWHSATEFKRYLHRFMLEFSRIDTLAGVKRTIYNQYDSLVLPLQTWLEAQGVHIITDCTVTDFDQATQNDRFRVTGIRCLKHGVRAKIPVNEGDLVFLQNGSMTDASSLGSMTSPPPKRTKADSDGWRLWEKLADSRAEFGNPAAFNSCIAQSSWESFTVTLKTPAFFDQMLRFTQNSPGVGGLVTFKDSRWLMSIVLAHQPHFIGQPADVQVFWGYALFPDRVGDFVPKAMADCSGAEILQELCGHLRFDPYTVESANCIPCRMPYITSMFMPRIRSDRPLPVPLNSHNLAFISQFVEIPEDVVFTVEYSVRAAQMAVYELLDIKLPIPAVTPHDVSLTTQVEALIKAFK